MKYEIYAVTEVMEDFSAIDFVSEGPKGSVLKRIQFTPTMFCGLFNLAFGDVKGNGELDDKVVSDNGDRNKVLATVVNVLESYLNRFPDRAIYIKGNTPSRMRLYRMAIILNKEELNQKFRVFMDYQNDIVPFDGAVLANAIFVKKA